MLYNCMPLSSKSSLTLSIHLFLGLPLLLSPLTCPCSAAFGSLFPCILSMCPNHVSLLLLIFSIPVSSTQKMYTIIFLDPTQSKTGFLAWLVHIPEALVAYQHASRTPYNRVINSARFSSGGKLLVQRIKPRQCSTVHSQQGPQFSAAKFDKFRGEFGKFRGEFGKFRGSPRQSDEIPRLTAVTQLHFRG